MRGPSGRGRPLSVDGGRLERDVGPAATTASLIGRFADVGLRRRVRVAGASARTRANPAETDPDAWRPGRIRAPPPARTSPASGVPPNVNARSGFGSGLGRRRQRQGVELEPRLEPWLRCPHRRSMRSPRRPRPIGSDGAGATGSDTRAGANAAAAAARPRGGSAARRTDNGGRDAGRAGRSSTPGVANRGRSKDSGCGVRDAGALLDGGPGLGPRRRFRPVDGVGHVRGGVERHVDVGRRHFGRRRQRQVVAAVAAPRVAIEADVLALRTLHGEPAPPTGASGASIGETIGHARWICAASASASRPQRIAGGNARQGAARVVVAAGVEGLPRVVQRDLGGPGVRGRGVAGRHAAEDVEDPIARGDRVAGHEEQHAGGGDEQRVRHLRAAAWRRPAPRRRDRRHRLGRRSRRRQPGGERAADHEHAGIAHRSRLGRPAPRRPSSDACRPAAVASATRCRSATALRARSM